MTTSQPVASEQYRLSQKYPSNREPTHEEWLREIEALRAMLAQCWHAWNGSGPAIVLDDVKEAAGSIAIDAAGGKS